MRTGRIRKPRVTILTPEQIAERRQDERDKEQSESLGVLLQMPSRSGFEVKTDLRKRVVSVVRHDPFQTLLRSGSITQEQANAATDLLAIYAASKGLDGSAERRMEYIDGSGSDGWCAADRKLYHIKLFGVILDQLKSADSPFDLSRLANAICHAEVGRDRPEHWRLIVRWVIGPKRKGTDTDAMAQLCAALVDEMPMARKNIK